jgi:hypothetical protein
MRQQTLRQLLLGLVWQNKLTNSSRNGLFVYASSLQVLQVLFNDLQVILQFKFKLKVL